MPHTIRAIGTVTALLCSLANIPCGAQEPTFGAYAGASLATISDGNNVLTGSGSPPLRAELTRRPGLQLGLWMNKPFSNRLSLQPELHYTQKGTKLASAVDDVGETFFDATATLALSYLEVPLLLAVNLGSATGSGVRPFLLAGPALAYNSSCSISVSARNFSTDVPCDDPDTGNSTIKDFDIGATVGGGLGIQRAGRELTLGVRYTHGLTPISGRGESARNNNFSVLFGIGF